MYHAAILKIILFLGEILQILNIPHPPALAFYLEKRSIFSPFYKGGEEMTLLLPLSNYLCVCMCVYGVSSLSVCLKNKVEVSVFDI